MSNSGSESDCIPKCVICLMQSKHEYPLFENHTLLSSNYMSYYDVVFYILIYLKVLLTTMMQDKIKSDVLLQ